MLEPQGTAFFVLLVLAFAGLVGWLAVTKRVIFRVLAGTSRNSRPTSGTSRALARNCTPRCPPRSRALGTTPADRASAPGAATRLPTSH